MLPLPGEFGGGDWGDGCVHVKGCHGVNVWVWCIVWEGQEWVEGVLSIKSGIPKQFPSAKPMESFEGGSEGERGLA